MRNLRRLAVLGAATAASLLFWSAPAGADPGMPPCDGPLSFVCGMIPMMPELDQDIDLTQQYPQGTLDTEHMTPADVCALSCI